jgi:hypothetical protein
MHEPKESMLKSADGSEACNISTRYRNLMQLDMDEQHSPYHSRGFPCCIFFKKKGCPFCLVLIYINDNLSCTSVCILLCLFIFCVSLIYWISRPKLIFDPLPKRPMVKRKSTDDKHTDVKANKKANLEISTSCAKIVAAVSVPDRRSSLEDLGGGSPGSQIEQSVVQNLDSVHQTEGDCTETAQNSSPKTD